MSSKTQTIATKEEATPALVPKLRFPEFRGAEPWKDSRFDEVLSPVVRERPKPAEAYMGLGLRSHGKGTFLKPLADPAKNSMDQLYEVKANDLIVNITFAWEGAVAIAQECDEGALVSHRFPTYTFEKGRTSPEFFRYVILDQQFVYNLGVISPGGAGRNRVLSKNDFLKLRVALPTPAEQQKIAECLSSVDELMAAQARKVDALKAHKKGLMQQLFPREGETQPRLRFPEFQNTGEWIQKTVGDVSEVLMCKRIFAEETNPNEGVPFYKIGTLGGVPDAFISKEKFEDYKSRYNYPRKGEVLITCSGTVGKCLPFDGKDAYFQDSNIVWLDNPTGEVSNKFLLMLLSNVNWGSLNSTTITRIYGPDLRSMAIKYPEDEVEQQRIASCLSSLDTLIIAETQKLEALKTHKKGLMQQLFPAQDKEGA